MTLTLTPKTEALLRARAEDEGQDVSALADTLLSDFLTGEQLKAVQKPSVAAEAGEMSDEMRATARMLAEANREAEPEYARTLLFPAASEVRLLHVDPTARPTPEDEAIAPYYFGPDARSGIRHSSAVALIRPEEEGKLILPHEWGTWEDAEEI